ncbi:MAG: flippase-like domain-containing protein [Fervidobacterium sp.]|nr:flippase-like domain-containing protein [Fervidobacterium sp.]
MINIIIALAIGLSIINIVGIFFAKQNPFKAILSFPIKIIPVLIFLLSVDYVVHALRLMVVVKSMGYKISFFQALENVFFNIYFSFVTPMSIGGQPFQIYHLSKIGVSSYDATNIAISRMFIGILVVFAIDVTLISRVIGILRGTVGLTFVLLGFLVTLVISLAGFFAFMNKKFLFGVFKFINKLTKSQKLKDKEKAAIEWIDKMSTSTKTLFFKNYWALIIDFALGVLTSLITPLQLKLCIEAISNTEIPLSFIWGILMMLNTIVYYIPTPGSSGGIEGFYQLVFSHFYDTRSAMTGILVYRVITYYLIVFVGTILIWKFARFREDTNISSTKI